MNPRSNSAVARDGPRRSPNDIAMDILLGWRARIPRAVRERVEAMAGFQGVDDENSRRIVSEVRSMLHPWRSSTASRVKRELETLLCQYRAEG